MIPALLVGDWLFVNKASTVPHVPFSRANLPAYRGAEARRRRRVRLAVPGGRGEPWSDPTPTLVKRLVGMPGDTLYMRDGLLYVNGIAQRQGFGADTTPEPGLANSVDPLFDWQKQVGLKSSRFGAAPGQPTHDNWGPLVVPPRRSS